MKWVFAVLSLLMVGIPHLAYKGDLLGLGLTLLGLVVAGSSGLLFYHEESEKSHAKLRADLNRAKLTLNIVDVDYKVNGIVNATSRRVSWVCEELSQKPKKKLLSFLKREMSQDDSQGANSQ